MTRLLFVLTLLFSALVSESAAQGFNQTTAQNSTAIGVQNAQNSKLFEWFRKRSDGTWQRWQRPRGGWGMSIGPVLTVSRTDSNIIEMTAPDGHLYQFNFANDEVRHQVPNGNFLVVYGEIQAKSSAPSSIAPVGQPKPQPPAQPQPTAPTPVTAANVIGVQVKNTPQEPLHYSIFRFANKQGWSLIDYRENKTLPLTEVSRNLANQTVNLQSPGGVKIVLNIQYRNAMRSYEGKTTWLGQITWASATQIAP